MRPRDGHTLSVERFTLDVTPDARVFWTRDHRENNLAWVYFSEATDEFTVRADFAVETFDRNPFDFLLRLDAMKYPFAYTEAESAMLAPFLTLTDERRKLLQNWLSDVLPDAPDDTIGRISAISSAVREQIKYGERLEEGIQSPDETLASGSGTCRDLAVLMMTICRSLNIAARFVSGYLYDPSVEEGQTAGSLHAWTEVFLPGGGWRGFDPTHAIMVDEHFIPVASGRRPENLNPITGTFFGSKKARASMETQLEISEN
jgi:transglutaminase-like putative cysteine protease